VRLLRADEARLAIEQVDEARARALPQRGTGWCYAADEMYLTAGLAIPDTAYYDDGALHENGVGQIRKFIRDFDDGLARLPRLDGQRVRLVTGASMAPIMRERAPRLERASGAAVEIVEVANNYFGETVTVAGLLGGRDILRALDHGRAGDLILFPAEALNADDRFIDDFSRAELVERLGPADVRSGYEVTEALVSL
jgi:NifB/MoaA-like Fe-S oxidoreductase